MRSDKAFAIKTALFVGLALLLIGSSLAGIITPAEQVFWTFVFGLVYVMSLL